MSDFPTVTYRLKCGVCNLMWEKVSSHGISYICRDCSALMAKAIMEGHAKEVIDILSKIKHYDGDITIIDESYKHKKSKLTGQ